MSLHSGTTEQLWYHSAESNLLYQLLQLLRQSNSNLHHVLQDQLRPVAGEAAEMTGTLFIRDRAKKSILQAQVFSLFHC